MCFNVLQLTSSRHKENLQPSLVSSSTHIGRYLIKLGDHNLSPKLSPATFPQDANLKRTTLKVEVRKRRFSQCGHTGEKDKEMKSCFHRSPSSGPEVTSRVQIEWPWMCTPKQPQSGCGPTHQSPIIIWVSDSSCKLF